MISAIIANTTVVKTSGYGMFLRCAAEVQRFSRFRGRRGRVFIDSC